MQSVYLKRYSQPHMGMACTPEPYEVFYFMEIWKSVALAEGYEVSNYGRIKSIHRTVKNPRMPNGYTVKERIMKTAVDRNGYAYICLSENSEKRKYKVHRLVAMAFCDGYSKSLQVNHIDGVRNNNHYSNLEWVTCKENIIHSFLKPRKKRIAN